MNSTTATAHTSVDFGEFSSFRTSLCEALCENAYLQLLDSEFSDLYTSVYHALSESSLLIRLDAA